MLASDLRASSASELSRIVWGNISDGLWVPYTKYFTHIILCVIKECHGIGTEEVPPELRIL